MDAHWLICLWLGTCILTGIGCKESPDSVNKIGTPKMVSQAGPADTDSDSAQNDDQRVEHLTVGDKAPDFEVEVMGGESLRLSSCFGPAKQPTVLLFNRAHW